MLSKGHWASPRAREHGTRHMLHWTRNSSGDEIANVNFFTTTSSTTFTQCAPEPIPKFCEITQNKGHYTVQSHSRSPILVPIESSYTTWVGCMNVTDDRQTDGRQHIANVNLSSRSLKSQNHTGYSGTSRLPFCDAHFVFVNYCVHVRRTRKNSL